MKNLTQSFRVHHQAIIEAIDQVQLLSRSYLNVKPRLRVLSDAILNHLSQQNEEFWNQLKSPEPLDREAAKLIDFLIHDLKETKVKYLIFFDKYSGEMGDMGSPYFPKDLFDFSRDLQARIKIEEDYLFPLLEKLSQK